MKKIALCGAVAASIVVVNPAYADLSLSGQVSPAIVFGGDVNDPEIVDNTGTGSRIRLRGKHQNGSVSFFTRYEIQIQENQSFGPVDGSESIDTRYAEVGINTSFGSFSLGKGDGASNATAEVSYQTTGNILGGGSLPFFTVRGTLNRDNPETSVGYTFYDGFSRVSRLRYDTPSFGGLTIAASLDSGDRTELAARFKRNVGSGKLVALLGFADGGDTVNDRTMAGLGYKFGFGLSLAASFSALDGGDAATGDDLESNLFTIDYRLGKTNFSLDFGEQGLDGENEIMQVGVEHHATKFLDIYGGFVSFDNADDTTLDAFFSGFRYKF